jgi:hypothetical protein
MAGEGEFKRDRTKPPLIFSPPLGQMLIRAYEINLFERGTKVMSQEKPTKNSSIRKGGFSPLLIDSD